MIRVYRGIVPLGSYHRPLGHHHLPLCEPAPAGFRGDLGALACQHTHTSDLD